MKNKLTLGLITIMCMAFTSPFYYPIDGYNTTGIKRLKRLELANSGQLPDAKLPPEQINY